MLNLSRVLSAFSPEGIGVRVSSNWSRLSGKPGAAPENPADDAPVGCRRGLNVQVKGAAGRHVQHPVSLPGRSVFELAGKADDLAAGVAKAVDFDTGIRDRCDVRQCCGAGFAARAEHPVIRQQYLECFEPAAIRCDLGQRCDALVAEWRHQSRGSRRGGDSENDSGQKYSKHLCKPRGP